jgi:glycolate oxidase
MIKILEKAKIDFTILRNEECCGLPLSTLGFRELFFERAEKNAKMFERVEASTIVTTCPGCYKTFSKLYPQHAKPHRILHSSQFIKDLIEQKKIVPTEPVRKKLTYHDPCDLGRHMGVFDPPRDVIRSIPNVEFIEAKKNRMEAQCCGAGGGFSFAYPEISRNICMTRLKNDILPTGAEIIVTSCPNCTHHFRQTIKFVPDDPLAKIRIIDLTQFVADVI